MLDLTDGGAEEVEYDHLLRNVKFWRVEELQLKSETEELRGFPKTIVAVEAPEAVHNMLKLRDSFLE